jgi:hypothetical protein
VESDLFSSLMVAAPVSDTCSSPHLEGRTKAAVPFADRGRSTFWARERRIAVIVMVCAALLAWIHLRHASIWYDEAITLLTTSGHAQVDWSLGLMQFQPTANFGKILFDLYNQDVHPPLYFWALALWRVLFGASLEVARSFSAVFLVATLALLYRIARIVGVRPTWVPVAIYAASSIGMWYAYDARPYAMATFFIVLTQFLAHRQSRWTGVCAAAGFATHYFAVLCLAPVLALESVKLWKTNRTWAIWTLASFSLFSAPLLWLLRIHMTARPNQFPRFGALPEEVWALLKGSLQGIMPNTWLPGWGLAVIAGTFFVCAGLWSAIKTQKWSVPILYGCFSCGFLLLAVLTNKSIVAMPSAYYLGLAAPWLALLVGYGVRAFPRVSPLLAVIVVVGLMAASPIVRTVDYRKMVKKMEAECSHCAIVVGAGYAGAVPACILYEAPGMPVILVKPDDAVNEVVQRVGGRAKVFFVPTNEPPTAKIEREFLRQHFSARRNGYFDVSLSRAPELERAAHAYDGSIPVFSLF